MTNSKKENLPLTAREWQVVQLIQQDKKYREIATELGLGYETVKTYATRIRRKLNLSSKVAVAPIALGSGVEVTVSSFLSPTSLTFSFSLLSSV
jgi:DNA-binding NarL/FixJ family response regulator